MEWIPNQPVFFGETDNCSDDPTIVQLVDNTDDTQFQLLCEPCSSAPQLMPDPNFENPASFGGNDTWSIMDGLLCSNGGVTGTSSTINFDTTKYYKISITVDSISNGGSIKVSFGVTNILGYINTAGTYDFYGFPASFFGNTAINLNPFVDGTECCISEITVYEILTNAIVAVYDSEGTFINSRSYQGNPEFFTFAKNTVTVTIDWSEMEISNGCYYLCLLDPCENTNGQNYQPSIINCGFAGSASGWSLEGESAYSSGTIIFSGVDYGFIYQDNVFNSFTTTFSLTVILTAISGTVTVSFGSNVVATITTNGSHVITGIPAGDFSLTIGTAIGNSATLTSICARNLTPSSEYVCNKISNTFKLADYSQDCTIIVNACNNEDGLGFVFENSGFTPRIRLNSKLKHAKYPSERSVYKNSGGKKSVTYFDGRKAKNFCVDLQPEYVHDFLRLLLGFDNIYFDNVAYSVDDDEYTVEYPEEFDNVGKVRLLVSEKTQQIKNINSSDTENVCNLPPDYLLQSDDLTQFITLSNGELILING